MKVKRYALTIASLTFVYVGLTGCFMPGVTLNGSYTEEVDLTFSTSGITAFQAETTNGDIVVDASSTPEIKVHAVKTIRALTDEKAKEYSGQVVINGERVGNTLKVYYEQPKGWKQIQVDVSYTIVSTPSVDLALKTTNGTIRATGTDRSVDAHSTNGDVVLRGGNGTIALRSTNGNVRAIGSTGKIKASTTNGNVEATMETLMEKSEFATTNGSIQAEILTGSASLNATSTNGSISISLPPDFNGQLDARTTNGTVSSEFPIPAQKPVKNKLAGPIGEGGGNRVYAKTTNSSIAIKKSKVQ